MTVTPQLDKADIDRLNLQGMACLMSDRRQAKRLARLALAAARALDYARGAAYARINQLWCYYYAGEADRAEPLCAPLASQFAQAGDLEGAMATAIAQGAIASRRGAFALAEQHFDTARVLAAQVPDSLHKFLLYNRLGIDALNRGDTRSGPRNFLLALDIAERFGTASHRVNSLSNLASSVHDLGNDEDAIPLLYEALDIISDDELVHQRPIVSANLAMCLLATGRPEAALELVEPFYEWPESDLTVRAFLFCVAAHASILGGQLDAARALLQRAQQYADTGEDFEEQMHAWLVRGMLDYVQGSTHEALAALERAHALLQTTRNPFYQQQIFQGLANIHAKLGKWKSAYGFLQQYQTHFEASSKSARDSRLLMRHLEKEMQTLKDERDRALAQQAARDAENQKLEDLNKELSHQIRHVSSLQDTLKEQAMRDHLTGLYNRRHFETCLNAVLHEEESVAVVILDLDFFKRVNDSYGHEFGDAVLVQFARLVEVQLRSADLLCRYGGEEFCLLLRGADSATAQATVARIGEAYAGLEIRQGALRLSGCTFSAGIAEYPLHGKLRHELLMRADSALYTAKQSGRNRAVIAEV